MMGKRVAANQLNKDTMCCSDEEDVRMDAAGPEEQCSQPEELSQREYDLRISKPKSRLGLSNDSVKPSLKSLFNKENTGAKKVETLTENPWVKIRGLNASFLKSVQNTVAKDPFTDLSTLFGKYLTYWNDLSESSNGEIKQAAFSQSPPVQEKPISAPEPQPSQASQLKVSFAPAVPAGTPQVAAPAAPFKFNIESIKPVGCEPFKFTTAEPAKTEETKPFTGFSFSQNSQTEAPKTPFSFSFNAPAVETSNSFAMLSPKATQTQSKEAEEEAGDDEPLEPASIGIIRTGAGEESEETLAEARVKLFVFDKANGWVDLGVGIFKVNKRKAGSEGPNRILCRSEALGTVLLNSAILPDGTKVEWTEGKKEFKLTCINQEGKLASYLVRTKEESVAKEVNDAIVSLLT